MAGIKLTQTNGAGVLNDAGAQHPAPVTIEVGLLCQLEPVGVTSATWRWALSKPSASASVLSSNSSRGPSFMPDIEDGSYSISLFDIDENEYILDIVTPTSGSGGGGGGSGGGTTLPTTIATYGDVRASSFAGGSPPASIVVMGREDEGDGGEGVFVLVASDSTTDDNDGTWLVTADDDRYSRVYSGPIDVRWFGAKADFTDDPDEATDNYGPITAAIEEAGRLINPITQFWKTSGAEILIPRSRGRSYYCSDTIELKYPVALIGEIGAGEYSGSRLTFPANTVGILVPQGVYDNGDDEWVINGYRSKISDLKISAWDTDQPANGITARVIVYVERCTIELFSGHGIELNGAGLTADGINVSTSMIEKCRIISNDGDGIYIHGAESSACTVIHCDVVANGGAGIHSDSALGSTYIGCHARDNGRLEAEEDRRAYISEHATASDVWINCYAESGQKTHLAGSAVWIGNTPGEFTDDTVGTVFAPFISNGHLDVRDGPRSAPTTTIQAILAPTGDSPTILYARKQGHASAYRLQYQTFFGSGFYWAWDSAGYAVLGMTDEDHARPGYATMPRGYLLTSQEDSDVQRLHFQIGDERPVEPLYQVDYEIGDSADFSTPELSGYKGVVCLRAGKSYPDRANLTVYAPGAFREPVPNNGHYYECTTGGTSAASQPTFNTGGGSTTTDGSVVWTERGTSALWAPYGLIADTSAASSQVRGDAWYSDATEWARDSYGRDVAQVNTATSRFIEFSAPHGSTVTLIRAKVLGGAGHGALPANMPTLTLHALQTGLNTTTDYGPYTDASGSTVAYETLHNIQSSGLSVTIDNEGYRYVLEIANESGANAEDDFTVVGILYQFTPAAPDRGAA